MYSDSRSINTDLRYFAWTVVVAQLFGLIAVSLVGVWMGYYQGGFAWQSKPELQFNYHPLFMTIGMVFLYADGILAYRVFRNSKKIYIKLLHGGIFLLALIFAVVGLKAVFDSHNHANPPIPNLYSLHSWVGLFAVIAFCLQWVFGFVAFLLPVLGTAVKRFYMPYHRFWGSAVLGFTGAAVVMGISENAIFKKVDVNGPERILINVMGISVLSFIIIVIYLVLRPEYRRMPAPEEDHITLEE